MASGEFRTVFFFGMYAIKIPRFTNIVKGMLCNRWEYEMWHHWRPIFNWENLCPIKYSSPFGLFLIMTRAEQPVTFDEITKSYDALDYYPDIDVEYKPENWGKVSGKLVCVDYGLEDRSLIIKRREYLASKAQNT
jgi:hypothetical protein